jgi:6-phosphogluconolactonase
VSEPEVHVSSDPAEALAERLAGAAAAGAHIALTGGSSPRAAYERAAGLEADWSRATLWFGDERCVPPDHEHSNYGMAKRALLDRLEGAAPAVHRMEGEKGPREGAVAYERELRGSFGGGPPRLDLLLLGVGPDAHCASLFPRDDALGERERLAVGIDTPGMAPLVSRVTLTLPVLCAAHEIVFLVAGEDKADAVRRSFTGPPDPDAPASLVSPDRGSLTVLLDDAAASRLPERRSGSARALT